MTIICDWCDEEIGEDDNRTEVIDNSNVSHTMHDECFEDLRATVRDDSLFKFLGSVIESDKIN